MEKIIIQKFKKLDAFTCVQLIDINNKDMGDLHTSESLIKSGDYNMYWVAKTANKVIGMIGLSDLKNNIGMILSLCVHPDFHGKGIGKNLLRVVKKYAKKNTFRKILLLTHHKNKKMMSLAISEDFIPEGTLKRHFRTGEDVICFSYFP